MRILFDAALFQFRAPASADAQLCARVLTEMVGITAARDIGLTVLDRGGVPDLGQVEKYRFPSYKVENSVADGEMLERMGVWAGADIFVSTGLTMLPSLPSVQLLFGEDGEAMLPGCTGARDRAESEIALAFASALVFAGSALEEAFRSRFPGRLRGTETCSGEASDPARALRMAEMAVYAAVRAVTTIRDPDRDDTFRALRRMQAAFEVGESR